MAVRIVIAVLILATVGGVALVMRRRPPEAPPRDVYPVPKQLDRADFPRPEAPWLVALFSSAACDSCQGLDAKLAPLESSDVAMCEIDAEHSRRAAPALRARRHPHDAHRRPRRCRAASVRRRVHRHRPVGRGRRAARPGSTPEPDLGDRC